MKDGAPFGLAGIWENWKEPASGEWVRTFAVITTDANELVADIHDRMPVVLAPSRRGSTSPRTTILQSSSRSHCRQVPRSALALRQSQNGRYGILERDRRVTPA
jgi:putative SOS response-associated peptidase YedK